jgi:predicted DNA-binding transcriptional regulator YafY
MESPRERNKEKLSPKKSDYRYAERLDTLKNRFLAGHRMTLASIMEAFDVTRRTAQRDIKTLETMGLDLTPEYLSTGVKTWRALNREREIEVRYSVLDATALFLGRRLFDFLENTGDQKAF